VICEGQPESPPLRTRGLGIYYFQVFQVYKVRGGAGQGSGDEKILNPCPAPHGLSKIQTVPANINLKTVKDGAVRFMRVGAVLHGFAHPYLQPFCAVSIHHLHQIHIHVHRSLISLLIKNSCLNMNINHTALLL